LDDYLIVLIKNNETGDAQKQPNNNIYAVNMHGNIVWNIKDIIRNNEYFPGFSIRNGENGERLMLAIDCMGKRYIINLKNLRIINVNGVK